MKLIKKIRLNKGVTLTDVVIALIIISILAGTVANMFYKLHLNVSMIRLNATAINYAVNILEDIDRLPYEEVDHRLLEERDYGLKSMFTATIDVDKYSDINTDKEDIIKIITLKISYNMSGNTEEITLKKLKIKEI